MIDAHGDHEFSAPSSTDEMVARGLADAADRLRAGEEPEVYESECPRYADTLRRLLPTIRALESAPEVAPTFTLGDYQTVREIGRGGMGVVYEAIQVSLGRRVALKVLPFAQAGDPGRLRRFRVEAQAAAVLRHPHIVPVFSVGAERGVPYYAMQLIEGRSLAKVVVEHRANGTSLSFETVAKLGRQAALALHEAHEQGIIHRDVKPSNLLIDDSGWLWVVDFGLALLKESDNATTTGMVLGTPRYMSPEQVLGDRAVVDHRVDIYGLGATLYELLTLTPAFDSENAVDLPRRIVEEQPRPPRRIDRGIPRDLETIVLKAMAKAQRDRYDTAKALADDVCRFLDDRPILARPPSLTQRIDRWSRRHKPVVAALVSLVLIATLGLGVGLAWRNDVLRQHNRELSDALQRAERQERLTQRYTIGAQIRLAQESLAVGQVEIAQDILDGLPRASGPNESRGFEWSYLWAAAHADFSCLARHEGPVVALATAPDDRTLASGGQDGVVVIWDLVDGRERVRRRVHSRAVDWLRISPDGRFLATASNGDIAGAPSEVALWDARTGDELGRAAPFSGTVDDLLFAPEGRELVAVVRGHDHASGEALTWHTDPTLAPFSDPNLGEGINRVAYSSDGRYLATSRWSGQIVVIDRATRQVVRKRTSPEPLTVVAFLPDGDRLATGSDEGIHTMRVADTENMAGFPMSPTRLEFSRDGRKIVGHAKKGDVFIYEYDRGDEVKLHTVYSDLTAGGIDDSALSRDGKLLAVCGGGITPTIRETREGRVVAGLNRQTGGTRRVLFASDGRSLFLACGDGRVRSWHFAPGPDVPSRLGGHASETWSLAYSSDGATLISTGDDQRIKIWDPRAGKPIRELAGHDGLIAGVALARNDNLLATAGFDNTVRLWDVASGRQTAVLRGHTASVRTVAFSPDGGTLASGGTDFTVRIWDATVHQTKRVLQAHGKKVRAVAFDPRGRYLVSMGDDHTLRIIDTSTWAERVVLDRQGPGGALAFSTDGSVLAAGDDTGFITAYDVGPWTSRTLARVCSAPIWGLAFSPDGRTLASACGDGMVRLSDPITGEMLLALKRHETRVNAVVFSPDGRTLASASHDGAILLWGGKTP